MVRYCLGPAALVLSLQTSLLNVLDDGQGAANWVVHHVTMTCQASAISIVDFRSSRWLRDNSPSSRFSVQTLFGS